MGANSLTPIGYYAHHHGTGHMRRALRIISYMAKPVVLFSSLDEPPGLPAHVRYVKLPPDIVDDYEKPVTATFHYTPYDKKIFKRNQVLIDAWRSFGIRHMYVDVSIEVAVLAKLYGLTVGHAVMHGERTDKAHSYGYDTADYLLAHMSQEFDIKENRRTDTTVYYSGGLSRYAKRVPAPLKSCNRVVVMVSPKAERSVSESLLRLAQSTPNIQWQTIGFDMVQSLPNITPYGIVPNPLNLLTHADLVIGSGGNNTIMEIASLGKPFLCIPEPRPYDEQLIAAKKLESLDAAVVIDHFPEAIEWPTVCEQLKAIDLRVFSGLVSDIGAQRAAQIIESADMVT